MLDHADASGRDDDGRRRGDVEGAADVAAGAAGVDDDAAVFALDGDGFLAHDHGRPDQLFDGCALCGQANKEAADLGIGGLAGHDVHEGLACLSAGEVLAAAELEEDISKRSDGGGHHASL